MGTGRSFNPAARERRTRAGSCARRTVGVRGCRHVALTTGVVVLLSKGQDPLSGSESSPHPRVGNAPRDRTSDRPPRASRDARKNPSTPRRPAACILGLWRPWKKNSGCIFFCSSVSLSVGSLRPHSRLTPSPAKVPTQMTGAGCSPCPTRDESVGTPLPASRSV